MSEPKPQSTRLLTLAGKHAVGGAQYAVVDADLFEELDRWRWKAKHSPDGARCYAVRNVTRNGRQVTLRLSREVLGHPPGAPGDVRFKNGDTLDCRRENLEICTRSVTVRTARPKRQHAPCLQCGELFAWWGCGAGPGFCSDGCRRERQKAHEARQAERGKAARLAARTGYSCGWCGTAFTPKKAGALYCSSLCRHRAKYAKRVALSRHGSFQ